MDKIIQVVIDRYMIDEDTQIFSRYHNIVAANLEEKMKDLIAATSKIEDLELEEQRLECLVKSYQKI